jgi:hypothetical protein
MPKTITIPVITRMQDCGDGGYSMYVYNTEAEMLADHPLATDYRQVNGKYQHVAVELTDEQKHDILTEDDPYENGYIGKDTITLTIEDDGVRTIVRLTKPLNFHVGQ